MNRTVFGLTATLALLGCGAGSRTKAPQRAAPSDGTQCAAGLSLVADGCRPALLDLGVATDVRVTRTPQVNALHVELPLGMRSLTLKPKVAQGVRVTIRAPELSAPYLLHEGNSWTFHSLPLGPSELTLTLSSEGVPDTQVRLAIERPYKRTLLPLEAHCDKTSRQPVFSGDGSTLFIGALGYCGWIPEPNTDVTTSDDGAERFEPEIDEYFASLSPGAVHVLVREGGQWVQQALLQATRPSAGDWFGGALSTTYDGSLLVASAHVAADGDSAEQAEVHVFERAGQRWMLKEIVPPPDESTVLTGAVAVSGDGKTLALSGIRKVETRDTRSGDAVSREQDEIYIYTRHAARWIPSARVAPSTPLPNPLGTFPTTLALSHTGDVLAAGATGEDGDPNLAVSGGAVYVFARKAAGWSQQAELQAPEGPEAQPFGGDLALSANGKTLVVRAPYFRFSRPPADFAGALYVFTRSSTHWRHQARLKPSPPSGVLEEFGWTLSLSADGNRLAAGYVTFGPHAASAHSFGAYLFRRGSDAWLDPLRLSLPGRNEEYTPAVALSGQGDTLALIEPAKVDDEIRYLGNSDVQIFE